MVVTIGKSTVIGMLHPGSDEGAELLLEHLGLCRLSRRPRRPRNGLASLAVAR